MVKRTRAEALETRDRILDTAEHVFSERGVSRTTLAEIADAAGVTRGAIYWHFRNKSAVFTAMCDRVTLPMEEMIQQAASETVNDPVATIKALCGSFLRRASEDEQCRRVFEILFHKCEYVDEMAETLTRQLDCRAKGVSIMERAFLNAVKKGQLPAKMNARRAANGLACYLDGLIYNWLLNPKSFNLPKEGGWLVEQYLRGVRAAPEPEKKTVRRSRSRAPAASSRHA